MKTLLATLALLVVTGALSALAPFTPARLISGEPPPLPPPTVVAGGHVVVDMLVDSTGRITRTNVLVTSEPYSQMALNALTGWRFTPAREVGADGIDRPVASHVLMAAVYGPPALTNGPTLGDPPRQVGAPPAEVPYPVSIVAPPYPPLAFGPSVVMLELDIDENGGAGRARVVRSAPGFEDAAIEVLKGWRFRPAVVGGQRRPSVAYVIFGFNQPVVVSALALPR